VSYKRTKIKNGHSYQASQFLLSLSLLIILHELGHFIPAKLFKTREILLTNISIKERKLKLNTYSGWLPEVYVMIDEHGQGKMALPPQPWEFRSKPAWQRLIIMLGGVTVNFILAFIIYIGMAFAYGDTYIANEDLKDGFD
jgi:regulator of sigma E protease